MLRLLFLYTFLLLCLNGSAQNIAVNASHQDTTIRFMQGFLHGGPQFLDSALTAKLRPAFWRIGAYEGAGGSYADVVRFHPEVTLVINDYYMIINGIPSQTQSQPWLNNWQEWDQVVSDLALASIANNRPVDYWNVWGEPDNFWTGSYADWIEMYRRTDSILHAHLPTAKISGPEFGFANCDFNVLPIIQFLDTLHEVGSSVDAVSWHEFCDPASVPAHVSELRDSLTLRPWATGLELQIPEYSGPTHHSIPGWSAGWLYYLEKSRVDWVSRACWDESNGVAGWSDCQFGLNGLFMADGSTTQPVYWVHRAYAELDSIRLAVTQTQENVVAMASRNDLTEELTIVATHFDNPNLGQHNVAANVLLTIRQYPYCQNCNVPIVIQRIPSNDVPFSIPLSAPQLVSEGTLQFTGDSAQLSFSNFIDGDVYIVHVNPTDSSLLELPFTTHTISDQIKVVPNPCTSNAHLFIPEEKITRAIFIFSIDGQLIRSIESFGEEALEIPTELLSSGTYLIKVLTVNGEEYSTLFQRE